MQAILNHSRSTELFSNFNYKVPCVYRDVIIPYEPIRKHQNTLRWNICCGCDLCSTFYTLYTHVVIIWPPSLPFITLPPSPSFPHSSSSSSRCHHHHQNSIYLLFKEWSPEKLKYKTKGCEHLEEKTNGLRRRKSPFNI